MSPDREETIERLLENDEHDADPPTIAANTADELHEGEEPEATVATAEAEPEDAEEVVLAADELPGAPDALTAYFADVGNGRLLTFDEELTLGRQVQAGIAAAEQMKAAADRH